MKKCVIVVNTNKEESSRIGRDIAFLLEEHDVGFAFYDFDGFSDDYPFEGFDFIITLGGDGTVLYACRGCAPYGIPVFPVNLGEFGFIAGIQKDEWYDELVDFLEGKSKPVHRTMINFECWRNNEKIYENSALNDVVVSAKTAVRTIITDVHCKGAPLGRFKTDGLIVATATGSTAYSASAGGPIIDPELDALVLTPLNSFSLSARPIVFGSQSELDITIVPSRTKEAIVTYDGQEPFHLQAGDTVKIKKAPMDAVLIGSSVEKFFNALRFKLNWSGEPHA